MTTDNVKLSLLIDKSANKVVLAEAGKDFIDILFGLLSLPLGTITNLLKEENMVGCVGNLYKSIEALDDRYLQPHLKKIKLLKSDVVSSIIQASGLLSTPEPVKFYCCDHGFSHRYVTCVPHSKCPNCGNTITSGLGPKTITGIMSTELKLVGSIDSLKIEGRDGGCVKNTVLYMVTDDLSVKPTSVINGGFDLLEENASDISNFERRVVKFGANEGVKLLKASLQQSSEVLSTIFLENNKEDLDDVNVEAISADHMVKL